MMRFRPKPNIEKPADLGLPVLLALVLLTSAAFSAVVLKSDDTTFQGKLDSLSNNNLVVTSQPSGPTETIPLDDIIEVTLKDPPSTQPTKKPAPAKPATQPATKPSTQPTTQPKLLSAQIKLLNNDRFTLRSLAWTSGKIEGQFSKSNLPLQVPLDYVSELWLGTPEQLKLAQALNEKSTTEDIVFAARDKQVIAARGVALGIENNALKFKFGETERTIAVDRLVGVVLARSARAADALAPKTLQHQFQFTGGENLTGLWSGVSESSVTCMTPWNQSLELPSADLQKIATQNGRTVSLSDLKPKRVEEIPYFDRLLTFQIDRSLTGKPIVTQDGPVPRGISVHSRSLLTYETNAGYDEFKCKVGFQQPEGKLGDALVRVIGDGKVLFEKRNARGDQPSVVVSLDIVGVRELTLEVDFGSGQDVADRVVWAGARLTKSKK